MSIKICDIEAKPGEKTYGFLDVGETATTVVKIPVMVVNGKKPGSKLCLIAGTHSMEYEGIEAVVRTFHDTNPVELKGALIMCPVLNTPGFERGVPYLNPLDGKNMNRVYPGDPNGTISEKMIYVVFNELIRRCDAHIDLHGGDAIEDHAQCVLYDTLGTKEVDEKAAEMARYFLPEIIREFEGGWPSTSSTEVARVGIPSLTPEAGALGAYREEDIRFHYRGINNVMRWLGMLPELPEEPSKDTRIVTRTATMKVKHGGIFYPYVKIGDMFKKGDLMAEIKDMFGNVIEQIFAPMDGTASIIYPKRVKIAGESAYAIWGFD